MPGVSFQLPIEFDLVAVFLFALTGVWAATKRGYDVVGAFVLAFVTGVGGGLLRDGIFLQEVPLVIRDGRYLWAVLAALVIGGLAQPLADRFTGLLSYVDAAAIGVYAVFGANKSLIAQARARESFEAERAREDALTETLRLARLRYQNGVASQLDVIDAERGLLQAQIARIEALRAHRAAVADLFRALGG